MTTEKQRATNGGEARVLLREARSYIADLRDERRGGPEVTDLLDLLEWLANGLSELVESLDHAIAKPGSDPILLETASKIAFQLQLGLTEAVEFLKFGTTSTHVFAAGLKAKTWRPS
jgi:hypothetical protein